METLIIQVDCRPYMRREGGPPQLGITVEAPLSHHRKQVQAATREYHNHDYHNLDDIPNLSGENDIQSSSNVNTRTNKNRHLAKYSSQLAAALNSNESHRSKHLTINHPTERHIQHGLQITQIQEGSIIDRFGQFKVGDIIVEVNGVNLQRPFAEAQKTLKQFVVEHTSHGPLVLKVLRKVAPSSSSGLLTTGSQVTSIKQNGTYRHRSMQEEQEQKYPHAPPMLNLNENSIIINQQQVKKSSPVTQMSLNTTSPTSPKTPSTSSKTSRHLVGALNTRRIGTKHKFKLRKGPGGFGIKIAERDNMHNTKNRPIYVTAITTSGSAYEDGKLKEGDMLLEINGVDLQGKSQPEVTKMLKSVGINEEVELVISRQELEADDSEVSLCDTGPMNSSSRQISNENEDSLIDLNVPDNEDLVFTDNSNRQFEKKIDSILNVQFKDGPGNYVYDIPLNDTKSAGLGLYLKYPRRSSDRKDLGIWIEKVITGGAAWKDGRLQPDDQILAINGINLVNLSNADASETLTAAVCRGIGPEAMPHTIKLNIQRRDPALAAKILLGTNNSIERSDMLSTSPQDRSTHNNGRSENSQESYRTALDTTMPNKSIQTNYSSGSSNQNSQNDSAMSPQTQASNSLRLSSFNDKQNSSDKTNETTSSAISQVTDFTSVPISEQPNFEKRQNHESPATLPKLLQSDVQNLPKDDVGDNTSSTNSWDDGSIDRNITGEEAFQRDGFGRRSISEKRHAQLNAKNTDTFRRSQKAREERERQRKLEEQLARQSLNDDSVDKRRSYFATPSSNQMTSSYTTSEFKSIYGLKAGSDELNSEDPVVGTYHREVPVDVHMPTTNQKFIEVEHTAQSNLPFDGLGHFDHAEDHRPLTISQKPVPNLNNEIHGSMINGQNIVQQSRCLKCGAYEQSCLCESLSQQQHVAAMRSAYQIYGGISNSGFDHGILRRSNSLESVQQYQLREGLVVPRAGTVRVARTRRVNESFRAAVDRSYEGSTNDSCSRHDHSEISSDHRNLGVGTSRITSSIANSTISTANDEKHLINDKSPLNGHSTHHTHKKSSSLLTKFLKFGSMKKKKRKNREEQNVETLDIQENKTTKNNALSGRDTDKTKAHPSKSSHCRTHSSQSHPNMNSNHQRQSSHMSRQNNVMTNDQASSNAMKQPPVLHGNHLHNGLSIHQQHRMSIPMCQYQQPIVHNNINTQYQPQVHIKPQFQYASSTLGRPVPGHHFNNNNHLNDNQQYSHLPVVSQGTGMISSPPSGGHHLAVNQQHSHMGPLDVHNSQLQYHQSLGAHENRHHLHVPLQNGCQFSSNLPPNQWTSNHPSSNGLWVTSSNDNTSHPPMQSIYGALPQQHQQVQHRPQASLENNYSGHHSQLNNNLMITPFVPQVVGPPPIQSTSHPNGLMNNPQYSTGPMRGSGPIYHNNMQPQHIYYYDF